MSIWSGIGSALGGLLSGAGSMASSFLSYAENKALMEQNQAWQERMSNTAHQRQVADLKAAGLNPVLSANGGASYGSVGTASASTPDIGATINSARALYQQHKMNESTIDLQDAQSFRERRQASLLGEQARNAAEEYENILTNRQYIQSQTDKNYQDIMNSRAITAANVGLLGSQAAYYNNSARSLGYSLPYSKLGSDLYSSAFGRALYYADKTTNSARGLGDAFTSFIPKLKIDKSNNYRDYSQHEYSTYTGSNYHQY